MDFADIRQYAEQQISARGLSEAYRERLDFELREIEKQSSEAYWVALHTGGKKFRKNKNRLVLPWLLGMLVEDADKDPLADSDLPILNSVRASVVNDYKTKHGKLPNYIVKDQDMPDIDLDCLPQARDPIKQYATEKYGAGLRDEQGYGPVCSVGTWQTYKFRSALIDVCAATGAVDKQTITKLTTSLPEDIDELKDNGESTCKGKIKDIETGIERECEFRHFLAKCPKCGSSDTAGPTLRKAIDEFPELHDFYRGLLPNDKFINSDAEREKKRKERQPTYQRIVLNAARLIGRVRNMGMHAGALIIADRNLYGNIPMARSNRAGRDYWISMWSEGRNTQLSKFGYIKWDILGLKTLNYIYTCCKFIEMNRGITFGNELIDPGPDAPPHLIGWEDIDPAARRAGYFIDAIGDRHDISLDDPEALRLADEQLTDGVFQFDTTLAKSILKNGVRRFEDLLLFNAMGHPGPMQSIPQAVANRDSRDGRWKDNLRNIHPILLETLEDTYGVIVWQEQLASLWQRLGGFTAPEAQEARKAVAKKWTHKLKPIRDKWITGATKTIGADNADRYWTLMETFGRYAFNKSHGISYCLMAHRCLWLKAHFAPEWWAAVMSDCHPEKLVRYMSAARAEAWKPTEITKLGLHGDEESGGMFDTINIHNLAVNFTVSGNSVNQGMLGIKGIGAKMAPALEGKGDYKSIDDFIEQKDCKSKVIMERFIKLGAFKKLDGHHNARAVWMYYQYHYQHIPALKREVNKNLLPLSGWDDAAIEAERDRAASAYLRNFPKRRKIPPKIKNWMPPPDASLANFNRLYPEDFKLEDQLGFEKQYLGYYLHSPMELYETKGDFGIEEAKQTALHGGDPCLKVVVSQVEYAKTKTDKDYARMIVSDGMLQALVFIWGSELCDQDDELLTAGVGIQVAVDYDQQRNTFAVKRGERIIKLMKKGWDDAAPFA